MQLHRQLQNSPAEFHSVCVRKTACSYVTCSAMLHATGML